MDPPTHVVLLPDLASGHLMPLMQAGVRMSRHGCVVTVLLVHPSTHDSAARVAAQVERVAAAYDESSIRFHQLPAVDPPPGQVPAFKSRYMQLYAPHVKAALAALRPAPAAILLDIFATAVLDVLGGGVQADVYFTSTAAMLALMLRLPQLHEETSLDFADMDGTVDIVPGAGGRIMSAVRAACMTAVLARRDSLNYKWLLYHGCRFREADGIVVNTVAELETGTLDAIAACQCVPPLYPVGPVVDDLGLGGSTDSSSGCVAWLDAQPPRSVVYLCFGSAGWLEPEQARELAAGLERSGHRFLWVLRGPPALLPEGFLERTAARGLVWPVWAPQRDVLAHAAVGAFVTHAGWNSCLESLCSGLPIVPWRLYAEQHLNAFLAVAEMGVAVPLDGAGAVVPASAMERAVRSVMGETHKGRSAREKAVHIKHLCRNAVAAGGSSHAAMRRLCNDIRRRAGTAAVKD